MLGIAFEGTDGGGRGGGGLKMSEKGLWALLRARVIWRP